jgi:hypothetical protein
MQKADGDGSTLKPLRKAFLVFIRAARLSCRTIHSVLFRMPRQN